MDIYFKITLAPHAKRKTHNFTRHDDLRRSSHFSVPIYSAEKQIREPAFLLSAGVDPRDHPLFSSLMQIKPALLNSIRLEKTEREQEAPLQQTEKQISHIARWNKKCESKSARETAERSSERRYSWASQTWHACVLLATARGKPFCSFARRRRCRRTPVGLKIALHTNSAWHAAKKALDPRLCIISFLPSVCIAA